MFDDVATNKRVALLKDLVRFHQRRESESRAFAVEARHHRERAEKVAFVIQTIERDKQSEQS